MAHHIQDVATADGIVWLTLHDPPIRNALTPALLGELAAALETARRDPQVRAVIVTGAGEHAFSAGADIRYLHLASALEVRDYARLAVRVTHLLETLGKPVLAALNGIALGGGLELAEACMLRIAAAHAQLGHPEVRIGAIGGFGGTTRLPRLVGFGRAAELLLTGRIISAQEAEHMGLITQVVELGALRATTEGLVHAMIAHPPQAVALTWEALLRGSSLSLEQATQLGADAFGLVATTDDFRIGMQTFLAKRPPTFTGRIPTDET